MFNVKEWSKQANIIADVLSKAPNFDKTLRVSKEEFQNRSKKVYEELKKAGFDGGLVYSDEHYHGDVPYLGGNTNISVEPVAGIVGKNGFSILAGLEGCYVAEQLSKRSGCKVGRVEMLKLADEEYPVEVDRIEDVVEDICGGKPQKLALLTPRSVFPVSLFEWFEGYVGKGNLLDGQEIYYKIKYEKSDMEMKLTRQAAKIADYMIEGMLSVMKPGMLETQVAEWGYTIASELGVEELGFDVMVTAGEANRSIVGKALNRPIQEGDFVHLGVGPCVDGLTACERCSVVCTEKGGKLTESQEYWMKFVEDAYQVGLDAYRHVSEHNLPAKLQEQALVDYFESRREEVSKRLGKPIDLAMLKPYTGTHNAGYTECQEFYGAITLNSEEPLGNQIVTMLDVAARGIGSTWDEVIIPEFDYILVEKTLGKFGNKVEVFNDLPIRVQHLVGAGY
ncbi:MAG: M24 family metallopeptidase [Oscillospiraceae bacterium]|nr:M24 family metallopeptidase [Oscillospiraceae bacterium]